MQSFYSVVQKCLLYFRVHFQGLIYFEVHIQPLATLSIHNQYLCYTSGLCSVHYFLAHKFVAFQVYLGILVMINYEYIFGYTVSPKIFHQWLSNLDNSIEGILLSFYIY